MDAFSQQFILGKLNTFSRKKAIVQRAVRGTREI